MAARHATLLCPALRGVRRAHLDHASTLESLGFEGTHRVNWRIRLTWWDMVLLAIMALGVVLAVVRYAGGIRSVANINNAYPWGWWVGFGIMTMIALGGPWKVWMILVSWAPSAALYEVGWCAFLYLNVLVLEFVQVPLEELGWGRALRVLRVIYIPIMLLGVTLSHLHQSSLGTLLTLIPHKINVLWWSEQLPLIFLFSAMMAGPAMAILEHLVAARWLGFPPNIEMLGGLARIEAWLVGLL